jgi:hypothetical protein
MIQLASVIPGEAAMAQAQSKTQICLERRYFIDGSDARIIMGGEEAGLLRLWRERREEVEREDLSGNLIAPLAVATRNLNQRRYEAMAGGVPLGWYIAAVCYATTVISLGYYPWNFLLVGLLFLIRNKPLHERAFVCCSSRVRIIIGLADGHVVHSALNSMKTTFALSGSRR